MSEWYSDELRAELSQGDIVTGIPFAVPTDPIVHLNKSSAKGHDVIWTPSVGLDTGDGQPKHLLARYRVGFGIVVSHDCSIDKPNRNTRILFAPLPSLDSFDEKTRSGVRQQSNLALMLLPAIGTMPESCVELRVMAPYPRDMALKFEKIASLSDAARVRLQTALVAFFVNRDPSKK